MIFYELCVPFLAQNELTQKLMLRPASEAHVLEEGGKTSQTLFENAQISTSEGSKTRILLSHEEQGCARGVSKGKYVVFPGNAASCHPPPRADGFILSLCT